MLICLPHKRILNGNSNIYTHSGTNLHEKNIQGLISKNLEHTGTNMSFKPYFYARHIETPSQYQLEEAIMAFDRLWGIVMRNSLKTFLQL
jgi:hypothetical protein